LNSHRVAAVAFHFVDEGFDGVRFASVDLTYVLSDGALGEVYLVVDARGEGEMVLAIDGEIVGAATTGTRPVFLNPAVDPDLMAELLSLLAREDPECLIPLEFECSDFGRANPTRDPVASEQMVGACGCGGLPGFNSSSAPTMTDVVSMHDLSSAL
jgi:hypothetical protein